MTTGQRWAKRARDDSRAGRGLEVVYCVGGRRSATDRVGRFGQGLWRSRKISATTAI